MPFSSESGKAAIRWVWSRIPHATALDIGCGSGTYARMFPDAEWTGFEIWEPYVEKFGLRGLYKTLVIADAVNAELPDHDYDVAVLGDVLEHLSLDRAKRLFDRVRERAVVTIVSIPLGQYPQDGFEGNPFEAHVTDDWTVDKVVEAFGKPQWHAVDKEIGVFIYGEFEWKPRICVYAIAKNEEQFVARFCESASDADLILIADTGSTDGTVCAIADQMAFNRCPVVLERLHISPWRFDLARNAALALIPKDIDICISLDLDEILQPGWREEIERVWQWNTTRLRYMFDWGAGIQFKYEKIHARNGYHWHHPCHEYPRPDGRITEIWADTDMLLAVHKPDPTKSRGQYLDLLKLSVEEDPRCPRNAFYYARELTFYKRWEEAIVALKRYLAMPEAIWGNERCYAYRLIGHGHLAAGRWYDAEVAYKNACNEAPYTREPWCDLAKFYYFQKRWPDCYAASMRALEITEDPKVYTCDPAVWGHWAHDLAANAAWQMGMREVALAQARLALEKTPDDPRLQNNVREICAKMEESNG